MRHIPKILVITLSASLLFTGCGKKEKPAEADQWVDVKSNDGGFFVRMPQEPEMQTQMIPTTAGSTPLYMYLVDFGAVAYAVMYSDLPYLEEDADLDKVLDERRDAAVASSNGKLRSEKKISIDGHPGRELRIDTGDNMAYTGRLYLVGKRLYQVIIVVPQGVDAKEATEKFLDSFRLL
ncbi:hypothetical protein JXM67_01450 [candidate division WOR-3 bacterium]|nr:hypothetical protein [candidate division WOR-3 bacterium]